MTNLTERIEIVAFKEDDGSAFSNTVEYKTVKILYANIKNMSNSEIVSNYSKYENVLISFRVFYTKFTKDLLFKTKDFRVKYQGQYFDIIAVQYSDRSYVDIKCKAVV